MSAYALPGLLFPPLPSYTDKVAGIEPTINQECFICNLSKEEKTSDDVIYHDESNDDPVTCQSPLASHSRHPIVSVRASIDTPRLLHGMTCQQSQHQTTTLLSSSSTYTSYLSLEEQAIHLEIYITHVPSCSIHHDDSSDGSDVCRVFSKNFACLVDLEQQIVEAVATMDYDGHPSNHHAQPDSSSTPSTSLIRAHSKKQATVPPLPRLHCKPGALGHLHHAVQGLASQIEVWLQNIVQLGHWSTLWQHLLSDQPTFLLEDLSSRNCDQPLDAIEESEEEDDNDDE